MRPRSRAFFIVIEVILFSLAIGAAYLAILAGTAR